VDHEDAASHQMIPGAWRQQTNRDKSTRLGQQGSRNFTVSAKIVRENFVRHFMEEGAVPWQNDRINDYSIAHICSFSHFILNKM